MWSWPPACTQRRRPHGRPEVRRSRRTQSSARSRDLEALWGVLGGQPCASGGRLGGSAEARPSPGGSLGSLREPVPPARLVRAPRCEGSRDPPPIGIHAKARADGMRVALRIRALSFPSESLLSPDCGPLARSNSNSLRDVAQSALWSEDRSAAQESCRSSSNSAQHLPLQCRTSSNSIEVRTASAEIRRKDLTRIGRIRQQHQPSWARFGPDQARS